MRMLWIAAVSSMLALPAHRDHAITPEAPLRFLDVRDLVLWERRVPTGDRTLLGEIQHRVGEAPAIQLLNGHLLYAGNEGDTARVWKAVSSLRDETGTREVERAAEHLHSWLRDYDADEFGGVYVKFTWTGPQTKPVPGLAIHSTTRLFDGMPFRAFRRERIHYGNDDLSVFHTFTLPPERLARFVRELLDTEDAQSFSERREAREVSVTLIDTWSPRRPNHVEWLLDRFEAHALVTRLRQFMEPVDDTAARTLAVFDRGLGSMAGR
ncbi:MAG: hypothetical protein H6834_11925 [Planctomycetes bacterium]|nr:hypothetical protein [Planctomycetota bacterium]